MTLKKILLADDDEDDNLMFSSFMETIPGFRLLPIAENGEEVFEILKAGEDALPDLIILDQNMPKMNGMQTLQLLKQHEKHRHIPVVVYSTYVDANLQKVCSENGAVAVFSKPSVVEEYENMVKDMLHIIG